MSTDMRPQMSEGLPLHDDNCPAFDGKRCRLIGFRPDRFCEPALKESAESQRRAVEEAVAAERAAVVKYLDDYGYHGIASTIRKVLHRVG